MSQGEWKWVKEYKPGGGKDWIVRVFQNLISQRREGRKKALEF